MQRVPHSESLPLFTWHEISVLERQRQELRDRINRLQPHSHRRVELTARLRALTAQQLALQLKSKTNQ